MAAFLTYALDSNGALVHVDAVANGAKCNCHCPHCKSPLVAKNGVIDGVRQHHFAHANGHECEGGYESSIHLLAKEVLMEARCINIPQTYRRDFPSGHVVLRRVVAEKYDERLGIKPDVEGIMTNGERLLIEFNFTHKVDANKRKIIVENHLKCLEIDLKYQAVDKAELKDFLVNSTERRKWIVELPQQKPKGDNLSYSSGRKEIYDKTRNILKNVFDAGTLFINPFGLYKKYNDLKALGYDVCEIGAKYLGFKADLLLYRSQKEDKGYIAICIRGRNRYECDRPKNLRVIDVVINPDLKEDFIQKHFKSGIFEKTYSVHFNYFGFDIQKALLVNNTV